MQVNATEEGTAAVAVSVAAYNVAFYPSMATAVGACVAAVAGSQRLPRTCYYFPDHTHHHRRRPHYDYVHAIHLMETHNYSIDLLQEWLLVELVVGVVAVMLDV